MILPFIIVDFYSLKAHFHTKQEIGMLYVTLRIGNITLLTICHQFQGSTKVPLNSFSKEQN